ncbi:hypothetical protein VTI74DRAFT_11635 [Chaetomium olivicolor]
MRTIATSLLALALPSLALANGGGHGGPDDHGGGAGNGRGHCQTRPLVNSEKLQSLIQSKDLLAGAQKLQDIAYANGGNRAFGSRGHNATVDYIYNTLKSLGHYTVTKQSFKKIYSEGTGSLTVDGKAIEVNVMTYTPGGEATASLVAVANLGCNPADYPPTVAGNIAFISRGTCPFSQKSLNAKAAGAKAAVIYNNEPGELSGTLGEPFKDYAPVVGISKEDGKVLTDKLAQGPVTATFKVDALVEERVTFNVLAETKDGDHDNVLLVGGHSDSVPAGPGINDDGSGIIGLLNVAKALTKFRVKNAVRFGFWSAEEFGLLGSYAYMNSINGSYAEVAKIRAYLNFDMIASPNFVYAIYDGDGSAFNLTGPAGSDTIEHDFEAFFKRAGKASVPTAFNGRSDYAAFIENGIPSGGIFTGAEVLKTEEEAKLFGGQAGVAYDANYHKKGDTVDNLSMEAFLVCTKAIADSVAKYALSFKGVPKPEAHKRRWDGDRAKMMRRQTVGSKGHAHTHAGGPCGGVSI